MRRKPAACRRLSPFRRVHSRGWVQDRRPLGECPRKDWDIPGEFRPRHLAARRSPNRRCSSHASPKSPRGKRGVISQKCVRGQCPDWRPTARRAADKLTRFFTPKPTKKPCTRALRNISEVDRRMTNPHTDAEECHEIPIGSLVHNI
jgi:hypothetical protein